MQAIYLIFLNLQIFYLYFQNKAANQANYSTPATRYLSDTAAGLTGKAGSTSPQAGYRQLGGLLFWVLQRRAGGFSYTGTGTGLRSANCPFQYG
jgi:hypothetical protein